MTENYWTKKQSQELFDRAVKLESEGKTREAAEAYQESLKLRPRNAQVLYNLGIAYATLEKLEQAVRCWQRAVWLESDFRGELARAFGIEDEQSESLVATDYYDYELEKAA